MDKFHATLYKRLDEILRVAGPRKSVMLALDGPAPLAKLLTQRKRRQVGVSAGRWRWRHA
jgi:5'-3' exoribonuclease 1